MEHPHNFMDKMRERPIDARRRILFISMIVSGVLVSLVGAYDIIGNLAAINQDTDNSANLATADDSGSNQPPSFWSAIKSELQNLNDRLGPSK